MSTAIGLTSVPSSMNGPLDRDRHVRLDLVGAEVDRRRSRRQRRASVDLGLRELHVAGPVDRAATPAPLDAAADRDPRPGARQPFVPPVAATGRAGREADDRRAERGPPTTAAATARSGPRRPTKDRRSPRLAPARLAAVRGLALRDETRRRDDRVQAAPDARVRRPACAIPASVCSRGDGACGRRRRPRTRWKPTDAFSNTVSWRWDGPRALGGAGLGAGGGPSRVADSSWGLCSRPTPVSTGLRHRGKPYHGRCSAGKPASVERLPVRSRRSGVEALRQRRPGTRRSTASWPAG